MNLTIKLCTAICLLRRDNLIVKVCLTKIDQAVLDFLKISTDTQHLYILLIKIYNKRPSHLFWSLCANICFKVVLIIDLY